MAKEKLFPQPPKAPANDKREPQEQFADFATAIFSVPKSEIDKREKQWRRKRRRSKA